MVFLGVRAFKVLGLYGFGYLRVYRVYAETLKLRSLAAEILSPWSEKWSTLVPVEAISEPKVVKMV